MPIKMFFLPSLIASALALAMGNALAQEDSKHPEVSSPEQRYEGAPSPLADVPS